MRRMRNWFGLMLTVTLLCFGAMAGEEEEKEWPGAKILNTNVTLDLEKATLRELVEVLRQDAGMQYMIADELLDSDLTVTIKVKNFPVKYILKYLDEFLHLDIHWELMEARGVLTLGEGEEDKDDEEEEDEDDEEEEDEGEDWEEEEEERERD